MRKTDVATRLNILYYELYVYMDGQTFLLTGQITIRNCIARRKKIWGLFLFMCDIINVNLRCSP